MNNTDVLLVSETHFTNRSYLNIPYYSIYHTEHPDGIAHGGTAVIISPIVHQVLTKFKQDFLQATTAEVRKLPTPLISAAYCPPRNNLTKNKLESFFDTLGNTVLCGGDYNCKHTARGSRLTTTRGTALYSLMQEENHLYLSSGEPTYWPSDPNKLPDLLDFFITKGTSSNYAAIVSSLDLTPNHTPILGTISTTVTYKSPKPSLYNSTDWGLFQENVRNNLRLNISLKTKQEIEDITNYFIITIQR